MWWSWDGCVLASILSSIHSFNSILVGWHTEDPRKDYNDKYQSRFSSPPPSFLLRSEKAKEWRWPWPHLILGFLFPLLLSCTYEWLFRRIETKFQFSLGGSATNPFLLWSLLIEVKNLRQAPFQFQVWFCPFAWTLSKIVSRFLSCCLNPAGAGWACFCLCRMIYLP